MGKIYKKLREEIVSITPHVSSDVEFDIKSSAYDTLELEMAATKAYEFIRDGACVHTNEERIKIENELKRALKL